MDLSFFFPLWRADSKTSGFAGCVLTEAVSGKKRCLATNGPFSKHFKITSAESHENRMKFVVGVPTSARSLPSRKTIP